MRNNFHIAIATYAWLAPGLINIKIKTKKQTLKAKTEGDWLVVIVVVSATYRRWVCLLLLLLLHLVYRYESLFSIPLFEVTTTSTFLFTAKIPNSSIHKFVNSITYSDSNSKSLGFSNFIFYICKLRSIWWKSEWDFACTTGDSKSLEIWKVPNGKCWRRRQRCGA